MLRRQPEGNIYAMHVKERQIEIVRYCGMTVKIKKKKSVSKSIRENCNEIIRTIEIVLLLVFSTVIGSFTKHFHLLSLKFDGIMKSFLLQILDNMVSGLCHIVIALMAIGLFLCAYNVALTCIRKIRASINYAYLPLNEEEVLALGFTKASEYLNYIADKISYGGLNKKDKIKMSDYDALNYFHKIIQLFSKTLKEDNELCEVLYNDNDNWNELRSILINIKELLNSSNTDIYSCQNLEIVCPLNSYVKKEIKVDYIIFCSENIVHVISEEDFDSDKCLTIQTVKLSKNEYDKATKYCINSNTNKVLVDGQEIVDAVWYIFR